MASKNKKYTEEDINNALKDIESNKFSLRKAALQYNIPKSTLMGRKKNLNNGFHGSGTTTILSKETEQLYIWRNDISIRKAGNIGTLRAGSFF